jgi:serine/threonine-protein phosphatase 2A regulatory subunit B
MQSISTTQELTEVITAAEFHPSHCNLFMYSSSRGNIKLGDMRSHALCDNHAKMFQEPEQPSTNKSFFSEIIASVSDVKFSKDGRYIFSRDFLTLKVWDINMESKPVKTIHIHEHLRGNLCDLYENDCIFDKFECSVNGSGTQVMTGSYNNLFHVYDLNGDNDTCIEASQSAPRHRIKQVTKAASENGNSDGAEGAGGSLTTEGGSDLPSTLDYDNKILHLAWHPQEDTLAIAGLNNLFMYSR